MSERVRDSGGKEGEAVREIEGATVRQTERQRDRYKDRQTDRQTDTQTDRQTVKYD